MLFKKLRQSELAPANSNFNISEIMYAAANNDYWQNKKAMWTVISAACNDAGLEFYTKLNSYVRNIADIDTCNIHTLKSIAQSVDGQHLTNFISETYPIDLLNLINLFSIPKNILLNNNILNIAATLPIGGNLDLRNINLSPEKYYYSLLLEISNNINELRNILKENKFTLEDSLEHLITASVQDGRM